MGKTLQYVSDFTFPSSSAGKTAAKGYAKGGMAMGGMKSTKPAASPAPKSDMLYSKKENTAKTLLADGKGAPMPHAKGSVNMAMGGMAMTPAQAATAQVLANRQAAMAQAPAMPMRAMAKGGMAKGGMSDCGMAKGGMSKVGKVIGEYKAGELHSGSKSGPMVTNRKQAVAIGMSEARKASKK